MGRSTAAAALDPAYVQERFAVKQDEALVRLSTGEPAAYRTARDKPLVRIGFKGGVRRIGAARVAWCVHAGEWPRGRVHPKNGDDGDLRFANLMLAKSGPRDHGLGGRAQALQRRAEAGRAIIEATAAQPGASLSALSAATGQAQSAVCARLSRLAKRDLACGPQCCPGRSWHLTGSGREVAEAGCQLIDDLDRRVLAALVVTPMGVTKLSRRAGVALLTARRRLGLLAGRGLVFADPRRFYLLTDAGRSALGDEAPRRWVNVAAISASAAKDVRERIYVNNNSAAQRSNCGKLARAAAKRNGTQFNPFPEFDRMTG
jgi:hypothetical protein